MNKQMSIVSLDIGYTNLEDDLNMALVYKENGDQDFSKTLHNYIELLKGAVASLELVRDTTSEEESNDLELITNKNSTALCIKGAGEIVERYIGFGIANDNIESDDDENCYGLSDDDDMSDSSSEYNELCASDDTDTDTLIGSEDLSDSDKAEESIESADSVELVGLVGPTDPTDQTDSEPDQKPKKSQKSQKQK